jgi:5-methyltetrahydrofolate--homocysteine methyltransferase
VAQAILDRDARYIGNLARHQFENGATYIDINAGTMPQRESDDMVWLVETVQEAVPDANLCLDSANHHALRAGILKTAKTPMLNSLSGEQFRVDAVLPLACEFKTDLIVLALAAKASPVTGGEIVRRLITKLRGGLPVAFIAGHGGATGTE